MRDIIEIFSETLEDTCEITGVFFSQEKHLRNWRLKKTCPIILHLFLLLSKRHNCDNRDLIVISLSYGSVSRVSASVNQAEFLRIAWFQAVCVWGGFLSLKATGQESTALQLNCNSLQPEAQRDGERKISKTYCLQSTEPTHTHTDDATWIQG